MFTPGIAQIGEDLGASNDQVIGATTGFVVCLGIGNNSTQFDGRPVLADLPYRASHTRSSLRNLWTTAALPYLLLYIHVAANTYRSQPECRCVDRYADHLGILWQ